ncbi:MAG: methylenetetrahydrofolate reductase [Acidobacteria bacterium]|nr:methylenetetrahydrofolate reductase [Acidobacteriota bacterium]
MAPVTADPGLLRPAPADVQRIPDIYAAKRVAGHPVISVEFFPPKTPQGDESLFDRVLPRLAEARPDFCSVTYGAGGGGSRARTLQIVDRMQREHGLTAMAHVTCSSFTRAEMDGFLDEAAGLGIRNILALRGDPPAAGAGFERPEGGFDYAYQLVDVLQARAHEFAIGCAGFPEGHPDCAESREVDWGRLRAKIDHGAQFVLTQLFFDNADYFAMVDHLTGALGVTVPITPGVLPILSTRQVKRFTALCGATLPPALVADLDRLGDDDEAVTEFGIDFASRQCEALLAGGAPGLHLYGLNRSRSTLAILRNLGLA